LSAPAYKRVLLKLSGEALQGDSPRTICFQTVARFCGDVAEAHRLGVQMGLVVGGGNIFRGSSGIESGIDKPSGDYMGMLATMINALAIQARLEHTGVPTRVMSAIEMRPVAEPYIRRRALRHLEKGRVVIFGAGTGNPFFTTDTAAALRANEIGADILFKATKVDGVYTADPMKVADAMRYEGLSYTKALTDNLRVMDATALSLCRENKLPILIFNINEQGSIMKALKGERIGTLVRGD
jgi:uridylate kinase